MGGFCSLLRAYFCAWARSIVIVLDVKLLLKLVSVLLVVTSIKIILLIINLRFVWSGDRLRSWFRSQQLFVNLRIFNLETFWLVITAIHTDCVIIMTIHSCCIFLQVYVIIEMFILTVSGIIQTYLWGSDLIKRKEPILQSVYYTITGWLIL
jgi:hypothetical protein